MPIRLIMIPLLAAGLAITSICADDKTDAGKAKKGLQEIGEFIGHWNLDARPTQGSSWKETLSFGWKFQKDDSWIVLENKDGKLFTKGDVRYLPAKKQYQLTLSLTSKTTLVFLGEFKREVLKLEGKDPKTGDVHRLALNTLSEGVRLSLTYEIQKGGKGLFLSQYKAAGTKEGETFAGGAATKKPECIVTGGVGTSAVSYNGKTYYVCCSGCRDEFNDNPKKYVEAFEKKNK